jgi:hypothetical protein
MSHIQHKPGTDAFLAMLLMRTRLQHGSDQIFLFGPKGEPLHVARKPINPDQLALLDEALALLPALEQQASRPLRMSDPGERFTLAALDDEHEMFLMVFEISATAEVREARALGIHRDLARHAEKLREIFRGNLQ